MDLRKQSSQVIRGHQRSEIVPAVDCHYIRICLLQGRAKCSPAFTDARVPVCCLREERNIVVSRRRVRCAPRVICLG
jgi:hypothetical protein